jgi:single-strand DNA-binding protein
MPLLHGAAHPGLESLRKRFFSLSGTHFFVAGKGKKWCGDGADILILAATRPSVQRRTIMASYNKVILMGNLTRDPEIGQLPNGTTVCEFTLAVNRRWKDSQDQTREETLFIDCTSFGKQGQAIADHLRKGRPVHVEGHLKLDTWEAQDGSKRSKVRMILESFRFIDGGRDDEGAPSAADRQPQSRETGNAAPRKNGKAKRQPATAGAARAASATGDEAPADDGKDLPF